jgi:hypothetical protein
VRWGWLSGTISILIGPPNYEQATANVTGHKIGTPVDSVFDNAPGRVYHATAIPKGIGKGQIAIAALLVGILDATAGHHPR